MNVLLATDGHLPPVEAADMAARLSGPDGTVTVFTAVEIPRHLLSQLRDSYRNTSEAPPVASDAEYVSVESSSDAVSAGYPGEDALVSRFIGDTVQERTADLVAALEERGVEAEVIGLEAEDAVSAILDHANATSADCICIGSHGQGRFEGLLGSNGTKVVRRANCSVTVVRSA